MEYKTIIPTQEVNTPKIGLDPISKNEFGTFTAQVLLAQREKNVNLVEKQEILDRISNICELAKNKGVAIGSDLIELAKNLKIFRNSLESKEISFESNVPPVWQDSTIILSDYITQIENIMNHENSSNANKLSYLMHFFNRLNSF
jgi:hypothetical protein